MKVSGTRIGLISILGFGFLLARCSSDSTSSGTGGGGISSGGSSGTGGHGVGGASSGAGGTKASGGGAGSGGGTRITSDAGAGGASDAGAGGASGTGGGKLSDGGAGTSGRSDASVDAGGGPGTGGSSGTGGAIADAGRDADAVSTALPPFIIGADISWAQEKEDSGKVYQDADGTTPTGTTSTGGGILTILKNHGFNYIRLRTFVNPEATNGYSPGVGYCDTAHTLKFAKGIKQAGMGFILDFHYSDYWADPAKQTKPAAWANLSFADLVTTMGSYTNDVVSQLVQANARPDIVQIGNEIAPGMLWEDGRATGSSFANLGTLLKKGIESVKQVDSTIKIMMHLNQCNSLATNTWWLEGVWGQGVSFDILGESCYDMTDYQQPSSSWPTMFASLIQKGQSSEGGAYAAQYSKLLFMAAEYSNVKQYVNDTIYDLPDKRGLGAVIWEPADWSNGEEMFDSDGKLIQQYATLYENLAATYGKR